MTPDAQAQTRSKFLAFVLRHQPESIGLTLDTEGWAKLDELIARATSSGFFLDAEQVRQAVNVAPGAKRRYELSADGRRIRAIQGHSTAQVRRRLEAVHPPTWLFHGTATRFVDSILRQGLLPAGRHYVHLCADRSTALEVGRRHGKPVIFHIDAARMHAAGHAFYQVENGVWLTESVPYRYLSLEPANVSIKPVQT